MDKALIRDDLKRDEGFRGRVYDDATGKYLAPGDTLVGNPTIAYGRELARNGISEVEAEILLADDVERVCRQLEHECPWWADCPDAVQRGLVNLAFNQGVAHLLANSPRMMACLHAGDYAGAARELLDGPYLSEVGDRARRIAALFQSAATQGATS